MTHDPTPAQQINPKRVDPARQAVRTTTVAADVERMANAYVASTRVNADRAVAVATALADRGYNLHRGDIGTLITTSRVNVDVELLADLLGLDAIEDCDHTEPYLSDGVGDEWCRCGRLIGDDDV